MNEKLASKNNPYANVFLVIGGMFSVGFVGIAIQNGGWYYLLILLVAVVMGTVLHYKIKGI